MCHVPSSEGFHSAEDTYIQSENGKDPVIRKLVQISEHGFVTFKDPDIGNQELDLNWKRLHNMAMPIANHQLLKITINGNWKNKHIKVNLGSMMFDNSMI